MYSSVIYTPLKIQDLVHNQVESKEVNMVEFFLE